MKKKLLALVLAVVLIVSLVPISALAATCDHDDDGEPLVYLTPDCANKGAAYATCSVCGTPDFENVIELEKDPTVHNPVDCECDLHTCDDDGEPLVYLTPDCANKGAAYATCSVCGTPDFENVIELEKDPTVHNPVDCECEDECEHDYIVFGGATPNCIHGAEDVTYICTKCGDITDPVDLPADPNNHNWYEAAKVEPNCKYDGSIVKICSDCGKEVTEKLDKEPDNHNWYEAAKVEPNCKYDGSIVKICSDCGKEVTEKLDKTDKHEWYVAALVEPNCENKGMEYYMCSVCGIEGEKKELPVKHNWYVAALVEPNCKYEGKEYYMCSDCGIEGETKILDKDPKNHNWYVAALVEANCKYEGKEYYMCSDCGIEGEIKIIPALGHDVKDGACTRCDYVEPKVEEPTEEPKEEPTVKPTEKEEPTVKPTEKEEPTVKPTEKPAETTKPADPALDNVPKTGDNTGMILATMTTIALLSAMAFVFGKKRSVR